MEVEIVDEGEALRFSDHYRESAYFYVRFGPLLQVGVGAISKANGMMLSKALAAELWPFLKRFAETGSMKELAHSAEFLTREREIVEAIAEGRLATPGSPESYWSDTEKRGYLLARQWRVDDVGFWIDPCFQYGPLALEHAYLVAVGQISRAGTSSPTYQPIELLSDTLGDSAREWLEQALKVEAMEGN